MNIDEIACGPWEKFKTKMEPFHNHICLMYDVEMVRLIGVGVDDYDFYYLVKPWNKKNQNDPILWASAVGTLYSLKGLIPDVAYNRSNQIFEHNGLKPEDEFFILDATTAVS